MPNKMAMSLRMPAEVRDDHSRNFPMAIPSWKIFPGPGLGNTVILVVTDTPPHVRPCPPTWEFDGVINFLTGAGAVGMSPSTTPMSAWCPYRPDIGWSARVWPEAEGCPELGKNAQIVMDDANLSASGVLWGAFGTTGQAAPPPAASSSIVPSRGVLERLRKRSGLRVTVSILPPRGLS
jgi:aldehyde dehydrogenase (NAD+)